MKTEWILKTVLCVVPAILAVPANSAEPAAPATQPATQPASSPADLVRQLGDDDFHTRLEAARKLRQMGQSALPALREARASSDPEIHARVEELLREIAQPTMIGGHLPQPTGFGSQSISMSANNGEKSIDIREPGRTTHIDENADGISMKVIGQLDGEQVTREYKASSAEQLKRQNPEAFSLYQRTSGMGQFNIQGGGVVIRGNVNINGGMIVGPGVAQPMIPRLARPIRRNDDLVRLQEQIETQMKEKNLPDPQQEEVKGLLKRLQESVPPAADNNKDLDAQMREYNAQSDALRKRLEELKLADPGDALPPSSTHRLGITATDETVPGEGLVVTHVLPGERGTKMGLREGDVIQKIDGKEVHSTHDLRKSVTENPKTLVIEGLRDGKPIKLDESKKIE